jgi:flagellar motor switch protein FliN/FliY
MPKYEKLAFRHGDEIIFVEMGVKVDDDMPGDASADAADEAPAAADAGSGTETGLAASENQEETGADASMFEGTDPLLDPMLNGASAGANLEFLLDVPVAVTVELGRTRKKIEEVLGVGNGTIIELTKLANEPVDIRVNHTLIAKGEIVVDKDKYGVRILETISRMQRIRSL